MQKKLVLIVTSFLALLFTTVSFARPPEPAVCPTVAALAAAGVSRTTIDINRLWFAGRRNNKFATVDNWTFIVGNIPAVDVNDAYVKATASLPSLFLQAGPFYDSEWNRWVCVYGTIQGYPAITMNPPLVAMDKSLAKYMKY